MSVPADRHQAAMDRMRRATARTLWLTIAWLFFVVLVLAYAHETTRGGRTAPPSTDAESR